MGYETNNPINSGKRVNTHRKKTRAGMSNNRNLQHALRKGRTVVRPHTGSVANFNSQITIISPKYAIHSNQHIRGLR
jgi:hypothetical protein